jgi:hypothetical protein
MDGHRWIIDTSQTYIQWYMQTGLLLCNYFVTWDDEIKANFAVHLGNTILFLKLCVQYITIKQIAILREKNNFAPACSIMSCTRFLGKISMMKKILGVARQPCRDGGYRPEIDTGNIGFPPVLPLFPHIFVEIHQSPPHCKPLAFSVCWEKWQIRSGLATRTGLYSWQKKILREEKATCCRHRMTLKNRFSWRVRRGGDFCHPTWVPVEYHFDRLIPRISVF